VVVNSTLAAFGLTVATTGSSTNPYMYNASSGYRNEGDAGLVHVGARYYDKQVGRFITRDTVLTEHPYLYCEHDPVNYNDPSGHDGDHFSDDMKNVGAIIVAGGAFTGAVLLGTTLPVGAGVAAIGAGIIGIGAGDYIGRRIGDVFFSDFDNEMPPLPLPDPVGTRKLQRRYIHMTDPVHD
jgi:RHS repeat-associated protein